MNKKRLVIAIDFDGTIVEHKFPEIGKLKKFAKEVINRAYDRGHEIIIWTCRSLPIHIEPMKKFLDEIGIKYNRINENSNKVTFGCIPKIYADVYIDDRSVGGMKSWKIIEQEILKLEKIKNEFLPSSQP